MTLRKVRMPSHGIHFISVPITTQMKKWLEHLVRTGLYGCDISNVARRIIEQRLLLEERQLAGKVSK